MADSVDRFSILVRESLPLGIINLVMQDDDVSWQLAKIGRIVNSAGRDAYAEPGIGAGEWFADWRIKVQEGGVMEAGRFGGNTMVTTGAYGELYVGQSISELYPDPGLAALDSWIKCRMQLRRYKGIIPLNKDDVIARTLTEPMDEVVLDAVGSATRLYRSHFSTYFWSDGTAMVARHDGEGSSATVTSAAITWIKVKDGTPFRFIKGQKYQAASHIAAASWFASPKVGIQGNGANPTSGASMMYCVGIDKRERKVGLMAANAGEGTITLTDGCDLMLYGTYDFNAATIKSNTGAASGSMVMEGWEGLTLDTGVFPGAYHNATSVTVDNVQELRAFIAGDEDNKESPTPEAIASLVDLMTDGGDLPPPALIAEQSLWSQYAFEERKAMGIQPISQGTPFEAAGGIRGPMLSHGAHTFSRYSSAKCREGAVHGLSPDSILKFVPAGEHALKWAVSQGGMSGFPSIFIPTMVGRQLSELSQAPYDAYIQLGCQHPSRNFRRVGFYSLRSSQE